MFLTLADHDVKIMTPHKTHLQWTFKFLEPILELKPIHRSLSHDGSMIKKTKININNPQKGLGQGAKIESIIRHIDPFSHHLCSQNQLIKL